MKRLEIALVWFCLAMLCALFTGCKTGKTVAPVANGYVEVTHPAHPLLNGSDEARVSFEYRDHDGKTTLIWPSLYGVNEVIKGNMAIFVGDVAYADEDGRGTHPRLFAVQFPEPPVDITQEVLWLWAKSTGRNFNKALPKFNLVTPAEKNDALELQLEFWPGDFTAVDKNWPAKSTLQLTWNDVSELVSRVKTKCVLQKDLRWHTPYIGKPF